MNKKLSAFISIIALLLCISGLASSTVQAANAEQHIYDAAGLLTSSQVDELEATFKDFSVSSGVDIIFLTTNDSEGKTDKVYIEDFYDNLYFTEETISYDAALMLINMDSRNITIQGYGSCEFYLNNDRIEYMLDDVFPLVKDKDYYEAARLFAEETDYYMGEEKGVTTEYKPGQDYGETYDGPSNYYGRDNKKNALTENIGVFIAISLVIGGIAIIIMIKNAGGKVTVNANTYLDPNSPGITNGYDNYVRTTVTKTIHVESSGGGGRSSGGGGRSSGGRSHSGGSRGF